MTPTAPIITVAIPTCNGARHVAGALAGLADQGETPFDLVVSDDRSDDATLDIVRGLVGDRARVSINAERLGLAGNWDRCVELSHTPLVAIFHQDDVMAPGHLSAHLTAFATDPAVGLIASACRVIDDRGHPVPSSIVEPGGCGPVDRRFVPGAFVAELAASNPLRCSGVTIAAGAHAALGGFDPGYRYVVDWEFWLRLARARPVAWLARPTVAVRWHPASETHRFRVGLDDLEETARLLAEIRRVDGQQSASARRRADARLGRAYLNRAHTALKAGDAALARRALGRALRLSPGVAGPIARDPRLAAQMAALAAWPGLARRLFGRSRP